MLQELKLECMCNFPNFISLYSTKNFRINHPDPTIQDQSLRPYHFLRRFGWMLYRTKKGVLGYSVMHHPGVSRALQSQDLQGYLQIPLLGQRGIWENHGRTRSTTCNVPGGIFVGMFECASKYLWICKVLKMVKVFVCVSENEPRVASGNYLKLIGQYVSTFQWQYGVTVHPKSQLVSCLLSRNMWDSLIDHLFQLKGGVSDERSDWYEGVLSLLNGELKSNDFCCCSRVFCVGWFHPSNWEKASIRKGVFLWDCRDGLSLGCALQNWDSQSFWMLHSPALGSWAGAAEVLIHLGHLSPWRIDFHGGIIRWILPKVVGVWIHWLCISHRSRLFCHLVILGKGLLLLLLAVKKPRPLEIFGMFALNRMAHWPLKMQRLLI